MSLLSQVAHTETAYRNSNRAYAGGTKMALSDPKYNTEALGRTKAEMEAFLADADKLALTREYLKGGVDGDEAKTLKMLERTFGCYIMESEEALALRKEATAIEGTLEASRAHRDEPHASTASSALVATAGVAGFLVAFGVGVAFAWRVRRWQLPSLAIRKRQRPLGKEFGSERTSTL